VLDAIVQVQVLVDDLFKMRCGFKFTSRLVRDVAGWEDIDRLDRLSTSSRERRSGQRMRKPIGLYSIITRILLCKQQTGFTLQGQEGKSPLPVVSTIKPRNQAVRKRVGAGLVGAHGCQVVARCIAWKSPMVVKLSMTC